MTELLYELYMKYGISHSGSNTERPYNWTGDMGHRAGGAYPVQRLRPERYGRLLL